MLTLRDYTTQQPCRLSVTFNMLGIAYCLSYIWYTRHSGIGCTPDLTTGCHCTEFCFSILLVTVRTEPAYCEYQGIMITTRYTEAKPSSQTDLHQVYLTKTGQWPTLRFVKCINHTINLSCESSDLRHKQQLANNWRRTKTGRVYSFECNETTSFLPRRNMAGYVSRLVAQHKGTVTLNHSYSKGITTGPVSKVIVAITWYQVTETMTSVPIITMFPNNDLGSHRCVTMYSNEVVGSYCCNCVPKMIPSHAGCLVPRGKKRVRQTYRRRPLGIIRPRYRLKKA
jgi:hypothetical protein